jgi:hypothetical protein
MLGLTLAGCTSNKILTVNFNQHPAPLAQQPAHKVVQAVRKVRVAEEAALIAKTGQPQPLPTGICSAIVAVTPTGAVTGTPLISCSTPGLSGDFKAGILAAAPFTTQPGQTQLHFSMYMNDMEPGVGEPTRT